VAEISEMKTLLRVLKGAALPLMLGLTTTAAAAEDEPTSSAEALADAPHPADDVDKLAGKAPGPADDASVLADDVEMSAGSDAPAGVTEPPALSLALTPEEEAALLEALGADAAATGGDAVPALEPKDFLGSGVMQAFQTANQALGAMNPEIAVILDVAGAWYSREPTLQTGAHDPLVTGFTLQQLEMAIGANVDPFFRFDANLVFAQFGVEVEEAYATTLSLPLHLQARAGQFLTRFGRINPTHPHSWSFVDQPLVMGKFFGSEGSRGLGGELSWLLPTPWYAELLTSVTDASNECCARSFLAGSGLKVSSPLDVLSTTALKQFFPLGEDWSLFWGLSAQLGPNASGPSNRTEIYGSDLYLRYRPAGDPGRSSLSITIEALHRRRQVPNGVLADSGMYGQAVYQFFMQYEVGARIEAVTGIDGDFADPTWKGTRTRTSLEAAFYPSHFSRLRVQGAYGAPGLGDGLLDQLRTAPVWSVVLALEVLVGAHGAHRF
jgi:hypothetical protein